MCHRKCFQCGQLTAASNNGRRRQTLGKGDIRERWFVPIPGRCVNGPPLTACFRLNHGICNGLHRQKLPFGTGRPFPSPPVLLNFRKLPVSATQRSAQTAVAVSGDGVVRNESSELKFGGHWKGFLECRLNANGLYTRPTCGWTYRSACIFPNH